MRWTERQRAMLREMGIALWAPPASASRDDAGEDLGAPARALDGGSPASEPARRGDDADGGAVGSAADAAAVVAAPASRARADDSAPALPRLPGLAPADWLVVAEPLEGADPQQEQLLDNMLRAIGVGLIAPSRERRAVFCALASESGAAAARATRDAAALQAAVAAAAPRCILAFGRAAAAALLGVDAPPGGLRGRVHAHAGIPVVVTFSLAFLLRHPAEKAKAWADLCLAASSVAAATTS